MPKLHGRTLFFASLYKEKPNISGVVWHQVGGEGDRTLNLACLMYAKSLGFQGVSLFLGKDTSFTWREQTPLLLTKPENTAKLVTYL